MLLTDRDFLFSLPGMTRRFGEDVFEKMQKDGGKLVAFKVEGGKKKEMYFDREV